MPKNTPVTSSHTPSPAHKFIKKVKTMNKEISFRNTHLEKVVTEATSNDSQINAILDQIGNERREARVDFIKKLRQAGLDGINCCIIEHGIDYVFTDYPTDIPQRYFMSRHTIAQMKNQKQFQIPNQKSAGAIFDEKVAINELSDPSDCISN